MYYTQKLAALSALFFLCILSVQAQLSFTGPVTPPTGQTAYDVAVADFNNDGRPDVVIVDNIQNRVSLILGNGDGTFQAPILTPVGNDPWALVAGRFNGDGNMDLAVVNRGGNSI